MNFWNSPIKIAAGTLLLFSVNSALFAQAIPSRTVVAVFSQQDPDFSETVTLYSDGKYMQSETEKKESIERNNSLHGQPAGEPVFRVSVLRPERQGTWQVLDHAEGQPIAVKTLSALSKEAIVALERAMPFGMIWDNQLPYQFSVRRIVPVAAFQTAPSPAPSVSPAPKIVIGNLPVTLPKK